jgi:hypothetical protein
LQTYRKCDTCGVGWFDHRGVKVTMVETMNDFLKGYKESPDVTVYVEHEGVALVLSPEIQHVMRYPFMWDDFHAVITAMRETAGLET